MLPFCIILFFLSASKLKFHLQSIEVDLPQERFCCFVWIFLPWNSCLPPLVLSKGRGHFLVAGVEENLAMWIYPQPSLRTQRDPDRRLEASGPDRTWRKGLVPCRKGQEGLETWADTQHPLSREGSHLCSTPDSCLHGNVDNELSWFHLFIRSRKSVFLCEISRFLKIVSV